MGAQVTATRVRGDAGRDRAGGVHPVEIVFGIVLVCSLALRLWLTRDTWFHLDDWPLAIQASDHRRLLDPYNGHLSPVLLGVYRLQLEVGGLRSTVPLRAMAAVSFTAVPLSMFLLARRWVAPAVACLIALPLVWFNRMTLEAATLCFYLSLVAGIACASCLRRPSTPRADLLLGGLLALSLACAGSGVAVGVGCGLACLTTRAPLRRWMAVAIPLAAWTAWWLRSVGHTEAPPFTHPVHGAELAGLVAHDLLGTFEQLAFGNRLAGWALLFLAVTRCASVLRSGREAAAHLLAWGGAWVTWWVGLALSRGSGALAELEFRYSYVAATFLLLALVPTQRTAWTLSRPPRQQVAAVIGAACALLALAAPDLRESASLLHTSADVARATVARATAGPRSMADRERSPILMFCVAGRDLRFLVRRYGPAPSSPPIRQLGCPGLP